VVVVRIQPGAAKTGPAGRWGDLPKLRVSAPPVDGAANEAVVEFFARALGIPKTAVEIVSGHGARTKRIRFCGVSETRVLEVLGDGPGPCSS